PELQCDSVTAQTTPHTNPNLIAWSFSLDEGDFTVNPDIEIDQTGKIYALHDPRLMLSQHGKITAHTLDGSDLEASCSFNKFDIIADSIYFDKSEITIKQGETDTLTMFILPKNCTHLSGYSYLIDPEISMTDNRKGSFYNHKIGNPFGLNNIIYSITSKIPGDYTLTIITDIDTVSFPIKVLKDSAVEIVPFDNKPASEISRYDIHGRKLPRPMPGINIIKMSDGTIRKEYVK
ncbi:MAG: hypothetical protein UH853_08075, partial [Muribaculaceae bacterium]|nr:hypothetical protein [Muribaculaceae bacterium]